MDINNVLSQIDTFDETDGFLADEHEPTVAELAAIEAAEAAEKMELQRRKQGVAGQNREPVIKPIYTKPKPKVKAALPENLFASTSAYKKTKMVSMEELNRKAEQEVRDYINRIAPLIERVDGTKDEFKFVSEDLMRDFINDYQDSAMQKAKIVKRYVLDSSISLYDLYKIIIKHLGIEDKNNRVVKSKQQKEDSNLREKSELHNKYSRIIKSGYIVSNKDADGMQGLECLEPLVEASNAEETEKMPTREKEYDTVDILLLTKSDYALVPKSKIEATVLLSDKAEQITSVEAHEVTEAQKAFYTKTLAGQGKSKPDISTDTYYDATLPVSVNEDNTYLRYAPHKCRSLTFVANQGKPVIVG